MKWLLVTYASRYALGLPEVLTHVRARVPDESDSHQLQLARDLVRECIDEGTLALLRLDESGNAIGYGEQSAQRLAEDEAWDSGDAPGDFLAATALGEALAETASVDHWLDWEYPPEG